VIVGSGFQTVYSIRSWKTGFFDDLRLKFFVGRPKSSTTAPQKAATSKPLLRDLREATFEMAVAGGNAIFSQFFSGDLSWLPPSTPTSTH
jgi:hypothetical protein